MPHESAPARSRRVQSERAVQARRAAGVSEGRGLFTWRNFFPDARPAAEDLGEDGSAKHPHAGAAVSEPSGGCSNALDYSDGLGAIYPPMMYAIMALDVLGYAAGSSRPRRGASAVRPLDGGRRSSASSSSPVSRRSGTQRSPPTRSAKSGLAPQSAMHRVRRLAARRRKCGARATGP